MSEYILSVKTRVVLCMFLSFCFLSTTVFAVGLAEIRERGVLRHLGITYANFVREGDNGMEGLDVELIRLFAEHLGVKYELVKTSWSEAFGDLTGKQVRPNGDNVVVTGKTKVRGDILANGLTMLPWREKVVDYSIPTFPTGVWLMARADSPIKPIEPSGSIETDVNRALAKLSGHSVLTMEGTCLDPKLYDLASTGAEIRFHTASQNLNDIAPSVINGAADSFLLDIPTALIELQNRPMEIKVIGPVSPPQRMGAAFDKSSDELRQEFNAFFRVCWRNGAYMGLVRKYYPTVFLYLGDFFNEDLTE